MTNKRRRLTGVVTRAKAIKTVTVEVHRSYRHPLYGKVVRTSKKYHAQDDLGCKAGDEVRIVESRPISKTKRWAVETIVHRASEVELVATQAEAVDEVPTEASG